MRIAIEEHWTDPEIDAALRAVPADRRDPSLVLNDYGDAGARLADVGELRLERMAEQGVDMQVISLAPPGVQGLEGAEAVALAHEANDRAAAVVAARPDRFRALAALPLAVPSAAAAELERAAGLGLVGAMVHGRAGDVLLDDPRLDDVWAVAERLVLPVFVHPQLPAREVRDAAYGGFADRVALALASFGWGWHVEAGTAALRLMARGVLDAHPGLQLVLGHWGELLLQWHGRADSIARIARLDRSITEYLRENVWITASGMLDAALAQHALTVVPAERIVFSTDYPFQASTGDEIARFVATLPEAARPGFERGNAERLFRLS